MAQNLSLLLRSTFYLLLRSIGLANRAPYSVTLRGTPLWWIGPSGQVEEIGGFYASRVIIADSRSAAIDQAVIEVTRDIAPIQRNPPAAPLKIEVDDCSKLAGLATRQSAGFSFWARDAQPTRCGTHSQLTHR